MLVLITYDVNTKTSEGEKRLRKVAKECINYGHRVQNSVFECFLSEAQFVTLKNRLSSIIDLNKDNVRFYFLGENWHNKVESLGSDKSLDISGSLII